MCEIVGATRRDIHTNGINLSVYEAGDGFPVVLCHGFPELAYSWRHQIPALARAGFRVVVPDQRGYGGSDRPPEISDYDIFHLTDDLAGLLDALGEESAVFVGHDWGGQVIWQMALLHPERVAGAVGVNTPYFPRFPMRPTEMFRAAGGENHYILFFQEPGVADAVLGADVRSVFGRLMRRGIPIAELEAQQAGPVTDFGESGLTAAPTVGDPLLSDEELDVFVRVFEETGFTGGLNWYRNFDRNWEATADRGFDGKGIDLPCLMITAEWDPVL